MKKSIILSALFLVGISFMSFAHEPITEPQTKEVNTAKSVINWKGYKVTGSHYGTVKIKSGKLDMQDGKLSGGTIVVDMASITCQDLEGEWNQKLVGHLKSDDFFGVETYPTATFKIQRAVEAGAGEYIVTGDLTIKNKTNPIKFTANLKDGMATANVTIDRSKYDVRYGSGSFFDNLGDKTIYDDFELEIKLAY